MQTIIDSSKYVKLSNGSRNDDDDDNDEDEHLHWWFVYISNISILSRLFLIHLFNNKLPSSSSLLLLTISNNTSTQNKLSLIVYRTSTVRQSVKHK